MTKEAKIGLLLGLGFIVAIAVVLRDVHQTGQGDQIEDVMPAQKVIDTWNPLVAVEKLPPSTRIETPVDVDKEDDIRPARLDRSAHQEVASNSKPRYVGDLPDKAIPFKNVIAPPAGRLDHMAEEVTKPDVPDNVVVLSEVENQLAEVTEPVTINPVKPIELNPAKRATPNKTTAKSSVYVVEKNDNLTKIALKVYGKVEGKRWKNLELIYEANKAVMSSMDDVREGKKLVIPAIPGVSANTAAKVPTGRRTQPAVKSAPAAVKKTEKTRVYIVKENDSLWKIAKKELGDGTRYLEISRLNKKVLKNDNNVRPGMRLNLPN